ncbi:MAG TPA: cupin domain-containing protein [Solirubrobacteraceae bacterium]|nr:cupin domain-containing protein [Solirubrobacteraceae bacterium]
MTKVNLATCELTVDQGQGGFHFRGEQLGERLNGKLLGAAIYEMGDGETNWPYHSHYGVEEWMYVVSGAPVLRDPSGRRPLTPGTLVAFTTGPAGSHTVAGPGRVVIFSAGDDGWPSAHASVYPDSDKIGVARMLFRRADALEAWTLDPPQPTPESVAEPGPGQPCPSVELTATHGRSLAGLLGPRTWAPTLWELAPGEETAPYHYTHRREEWALVVSGTPTLRRPDGDELLERCDLVSFPEGPHGAHRLSNHAREPARLLVISTPVGSSMSTVYPEEGTIVIRLSDREGFRFRLSDRIQDYWDGEPGAYQPA